MSSSGLHGHTQNILFSLTHKYTHIYLKKKKKECSLDLLNFGIVNILESMILCCQAYIT